LSDLALKLIAENKRFHNTSLDLGHCGLNILPPEISELVWLESLSLADEWFEWADSGLLLRTSQNRRSPGHGASNRQLRDLRPLAGLTTLRKLMASGTEIADLTPLAGLSALRLVDLSRTKVSDLTPLAGLRNLQTVYVSNTAVSDISPLRGASGLSILDLTRTKVINLTPLAALLSLARLSVSGTDVIDLAPLALLKALQSLHLSYTPVTDLGPLSDLHSLQVVDISGTKVSSLSALVPAISRGCPVRWSSERWLGQGIYVELCPLTTPPPEIVKQSSEAILNYFHERDLGDVDHLYEAKMLILGDGGAGKTSLLRRLYQPSEPLPTEKETTKGIEIYKHEFFLRNGRRFRLNVWDFGGQEIYHATHQFFLTHRSLYLLVDDTRRDHKSVSDEGFRYWLELIDVFSEHSPVLIFQNEKGDRSKAIDIGGIKSRYDNVKELYRGNLELGDSAAKVREGIEFFSGNLSHIGEELPARWIKVRSDIELRASETPHISQKEYFEIYTRHMEFDRTKALHLSRYLHDLGVFLHFQDETLLARTVILQNQWATTAAFRILDDEIIKARFGRFDEDDCARLWQHSAYAEMHPELLAMMKRFELCYELRDCRPPTWLAPQLLPPAKPQELASWTKQDDLVLRYHYEFLPRGIISRLTVRLNRFVRRPEMAWRTGVLLEYSPNESYRAEQPADRQEIASSAVLVELLANGSEIELRARGPERKAILTVVATDLDALNESFQGLRDKVEKRVPCNCNAVSLPHFYSERDLLRRKADNKLEMECPKSYEIVNVLNLLEGVRTDILPGWAKEGQLERNHRVIRIFLASSAELREDRDALDLYLRQQNDHLRRTGLYLEIVRWENSLDAISETRSQDEYNREIRTCDIFVCLFFTKTGRFTEEEFDTAFRQFKNTGRPRIYTYFKDSQIKTGSARKEDLTSLWAFQDKLRELGHFPTSYDNIDDLKRQLRDQLDRLSAMAAKV